MKKILLGTFIFICFLSMNSSAQAATIFGNPVTWSFKTFDIATINPTNIVGSYFDYNYNSFDWSDANNWEQTSEKIIPMTEPFLKAFEKDLALQTKVNIGSNKVENLSLNLFVNDSFSLYVNGSLLKETYNDHFITLENYIYNSNELDASLFQPGENLVQVLVNNNALCVAYDMDLTGDMIPVPEPSSMALGLLGLTGLLRLKKKNHNT